MINNKKVNYFLISVSNRYNLDLCTKYGLAGFTNSINGLWAFLDIEEGDYVSFLYGAKIKNLYKVTKKVAYKNAKNLPPWPPVTFKMSGNTYYFPFRLFLKQEREFDEGMVRAEFSYVAENLLLRGGYKKTHFQADTLTFYNASEMGEPFKGELEKLEVREDYFQPKIVFNRSLEKAPEKFYFKEVILQSIIRKRIKYLVLDKIRDHFGMDNSSEEFEVLGEKALPTGFVDIFIKLKHPTVRNKYLLVEVKTGKARRKDFEQLNGYIEELGEETFGGVLIAKEFSSNYKDQKNILPVKYGFKNLNPDKEYYYHQLLDLLTLEIIK